MTGRRATATIAMRRASRFGPVRCVRSLNQRFSVLAGWYRIRVHAVSISNARTRRLPCLLIP